MINTNLTLIIVDYCSSVFIYQLENIMTNPSKGDINVNAFKRGIRYVTEFLFEFHIRGTYGVTIKRFTNKGNKFSLQIHIVKL